MKLKTPRKPKTPTAQSKAAAAAPVTPKAAGLHRIDSFNQDDDSDDDDSLFEVENLDETEIDDRKPAAKRTKDSAKKSKSKKETARLKDPSEIEGQTGMKRSSSVRTPKNRPPENHQSPADERKTNSPAVERGETTENETLSSLQTEQV